MLASLPFASKTCLKTLQVTNVQDLPMQETIHNVTRADFRKFGENAIVSIICFTRKNSQYLDLYKYLCMNR